MKGMKMRFKRYTYVLALMLIQLFSAAKATASVTEKDIQVIARIIGFLEKSPKGNVEIAVIKDNPNTQKDIEAFLALIGSSKTVGNITLTAIPTNYADLASTKAKVIFIPHGTDEAQLDKLFTLASHHKLVTISNSEQCLIKKKCAISIISAPAVDIKISIAAATATNVSLSPTFRMMIKEVQ